MADKITVGLSILTATFDGWDKEFILSQEDLGIFKVNEKTFTKPGRQISKGKFLLAESVIPSIKMADGYLCPWFQVLLPTKAINDLNGEDFKAKLMAHSVKVRSKISEVVRSLTC
jgi:hypothetical protein